MVFSHKDRVTTSSLSTEVVNSLMALPSCSHGPANRFTRKSAKDGSARDFYACSAVRDRKECPLFHWVDEWERKMALKRKLADPEDVEPTTSYSSLSQDHHHAQLVRRKLTPSSAMGDDFLANSKIQSASQYFFDNQTLDLMVELIKSIRPQPRVLCLGCPTIATRLSEFTSPILLDIDDRLPNVVKFNMFTNHFFDSQDHHQVRSMEFDLVVADPPFQPALLPKLASTIRSLAPDARLFLCFPYFENSAVQASFPLLKRTDIRLSYENHRKYKGAGRTPVRLYVSASLEDDCLETGFLDYVCCPKCKRLVHASLNRHCDDCETCTTIHGSAFYVHCKTCKKCIKPGWEHCDHCQRCTSPDHHCSAA